MLNALLHYITWLNILCICCFCCLCYFLIILSKRLRGSFNKLPKWRSESNNIDWIHTHLYKKFVNVYIELSDCNHIQSQNLSVVSKFVVEFDFYTTPSLTWQPNKNYWRTSKGTLMCVSRGTTTHHRMKRSWRSYLKNKGHWKLDSCSMVMSLQEVQALLIFKASSNLEEDTP